LQQAARSYLETLEAPKRSILQIDVKKQGGYFGSLARDNTGASGRPTFLQSRWSKATAKIPNSDVQEDDEPKT
jgi:hypothetical protein